MRYKQTTLLFHPAFLLSLSVLICNDFFWEAHYHNWLTGKLSDVAGLVVLPVFMMTFFPKQKKEILLFTALFFSWWKFPFSETSIHFINQIFSLPVSRVVDYTDLFALPALFAAGAIKPVSLSFNRQAALCMQCSLGALTVFALCATSMPYRSLFMAHPNSNDVYFHETFTQKRSAEAILQTLVAKGIAYRLDFVMYYPILNQQKLYYRKEVNDSAFTYRQISQADDSTLYIKQEGSPYFLIPAYTAAGDGQRLSFRNIRFRLSENKKGTKTSIVVETFESPGAGPYTITEKNTKRAYREALKKLFTEK